MANADTIESDTIPEDTEVLIPSLRITCDGYISHVSVGYKVIYESTINQDGVYLQLWRTAVGTRNYSLVEEVLLPVGDPWPGNNNQSILKDFELPSRIAVQSNDVIGFRTPWDSSVEVLMDTTDQREILEYDSNSPTVLNVTGISQIIITNSKFTNNKINVLYNYRIAQNFGGRKLWRIWRFIANPPKFYPPKRCEIS